MSKTSKGNYYEKKTREWLESKGAWVIPAKKIKSWLRIKDRSLPIMGDIWGADLMWRTDTDMGFVQVKAHRTDVSRGRRALSEGPWPPSVKRWVVWWKPRSRNKDPEIFEVTDTWRDTEENKHV